LNQQALKQMRLAVAKVINENPEKIIIWVQPEIDNGFGGKMADPFGKPVPTIKRGRICDSSNGLDFVVPNTLGFSDGNSCFFLTDHTTIIEPETKFEARGTMYRIVKVNTIHRFGGVVCFQYMIKEASDGI